MYVPLRKASEITGIPKYTLRVYAEKELIKTYKTPSKHYMFSKNDLERFIGNVNPQEKHKIIYARVSAQKQTDDLERQIFFL